ncbi:MAG: hypothetical protein KGP27_00325 [Hyphomicrobiales bacterium]|nr:hypothetical protein [Hyphomicrobiales bacterium]
MAEVPHGARSAPVPTLIDIVTRTSAGIIDVATAAASERDRARAAERHYTRHCHSGCGREETRGEAAGSTFEQFYRR